MRTIKSPAKSGTITKAVAAKAVKTVASRRILMLEKKVDENIQLVLEIKALKLKLKLGKKENEDLKAKIRNDSWASNPDRMGGCFTQEEIERSRNGGW
jgi:hypothetical protein